ncbi:Hypothetical protein NTJ_14746 [Nesidiocoris tenuis]|uniref:Uncharacterized protein n=1 Tax=Nesidiocoris tenuis TaxID=355587 RepID=A0ABN7BE11_9HEMI|nr:Hypothetical protein NTJ_14746 [Nesidiocoris tenuis]
MGRGRRSDCSVGNGHSQLPKLNYCNFEVKGPQSPVGQETLISDASALRSALLCQGLHTPSLFSFLKADPVPQEVPPSE